MSILRKIIVSLFITLIIATPFMNIALANSAPISALTGRVFADLNGNGKIDRGEAGLGGVTISIYSLANRKISDTVTDKNGYYHFSENPGVYLLILTAPSGYRNSTPTKLCAILAGQSETTNFGLIPPAPAPKNGLLQGYVFNDLNRNGKFDSNEKGLPGVGIKIYDNSYRFVTQLTTDKNGFYSYSVKPGQYIVSVIPPSGDVYTMPSHVSIAVASGKTANVNFGLAQPKISTGAILGLKYLDVNGNGVFDNGDRPLSGWSISITGPGCPMSTVTDANGRFQFSGLAPGQYVISEVQQQGYVNTSPRTMTVTLQCGQTLNVTSSYGLFGNKPVSALTGNIVGLKYNDTNTNGLFDNGDRPLQGWTINLTNATGLLISTVTNASGKFAFTGLAPGQYTISELQQGGFFNTSPSTYNVVVTAGTTLNVTSSYGLFGNAPALPLSKYDVVIQALYGPGAHVLDTNNNGKLDTGDQITYMVNGVYQTKPFTDNEILDLVFKTAMIINSDTMNIELGSGRIGFADSPSQAKFNPLYWQQTSINGTNYWQVKSGVNPSDAINDVFNPASGGSYSLDTGASSNLIGYKSILDTIGADNFNKDFKNLAINGSASNYTNQNGVVVNAPNGSMQVTSGSVNDNNGNINNLVPGDFTYFRNLNLPAGSTSSGENGVYLGTSSNPQFFGNPDGTFTGTSSPLGYGNLASFIGSCDPAQLATLNNPPVTTWS